MGITITKAIITILLISQIKAKKLRIVNTIITIFSFKSKRYNKLMILIVGLGNRGKKYQLTRHNIGFRVVDELRSSSHIATARVIDEFRKRNNFSDFRVSKKFGAEISEGILDGKKIIFAKPLTFINLSGKAVKKLIENWKLKIKNLIVIHDDIDLPLGKIKISKSRGAAGHKGVESVIKELRTKNFVRFRIGIKPKQYHRLVHGTVKNFVLQKFTKKEEKIVREVIKKTVEAIEIATKKGLDEAMTTYNK
jgi:PTH1 family peptidyl-tRNA hydrolase